MKIFVSYSRKDPDFARQVYDYFKDSGHDIFTDVNNIKPGDVWSSTIENNISNCDVFVIIVTYAALSSPEVEKEVLNAKAQKKKIIPAIHNSVKYTDIKWDLNRIQGIEFEDKHELARSLDLKIIRNRERLAGLAEETGRRQVNDPILEFIEKARMLLEEEQYDNAIKIFDSILMLRSGHIEALNGKGLALLKQEKYEEALERFKEVLQIKPKHPDASTYVEMITYRISKERDGKAKSSGENIEHDTALEKRTEQKVIKALNDSTQIPAKLIRKGARFYEKGMFQDAILCYDEALKVEPRSELAWTNKGIALEAKGDYEGSLSSFKKASKINPHSQMYYDRIIELEQKLGRSPLPKEGRRATKLKEQEQKLQHAEVGAIYPEDKYAIKGSVKYPDGRPVSGIKIQAMDSDQQLFQDHNDSIIGIVSVNDSDGTFEVTFDPKSFKNRWIEGYPDIYLMVRNALDGHIIYKTEIRRTVKPNTYDLIFDITINTIEEGYIDNQGNYDNNTLYNPFQAGNERVITAFTRLGDVQFVPASTDRNLPLLINSINGWTFYTREDVWRKINYDGPQVPRYPWQDDTHSHRLSWESV